MMSPERLEEIRTRFAMISAFPFGVRLSDIDQVFLVVAMNDLIHEVDDLAKRVHRMEPKP